MAKTVKEKQTVYFRGHRSDSIYRAVVTKVMDKSIKVSCVSVVNRQGKRIAPADGTLVLPAEKIWTSPGELHDAIGREKRLRIKRYGSQIKDMEDLLKFPLKYDLYRKSQTYNMEAYIAYRIRVKELTGITLR